MRPAETAAVFEDFQERRRSQPLIAIGLVGLAYAVTLLGIASPGGVLFSTLTQALFVVPGIFIARAAVGAAGGWLVPLTFGPLLGVAVSSLTLLILWAAGARGLWALAAAPAAATALVWPAQRLKGRIRLAATADGDWLWLALALLVVPLVVARPFALVGADLDGGQAYRAYFTADYVWRRAVVAELAKGDFLPANPFYAGDTLHYYWLPHLADALQYRAIGNAMPLDALLMSHSVLVDALFVAFLYGAARTFVARPWAAGAAVAFAVLFSSFEGAYVLWDHWREGTPLEKVRYLNIDAISRWLFGSMPIDGLQRVLLYQPHHALGYAVGLSGVIAVARRTHRNDPIAFSAAGVLLALSVLISSFSGLMFTAIAAVYEGISVVRWREWTRGVLHAALAAVPLAAALGLATALEYVDRSGSVVDVGLNSVAATNVLPATFLSFGPVLLLCAAGAWLAWRGRRADFIVFAAYLAVNIAFYFFVDVRDHQHVYVGWRVGALLFMAAPAIIGLLFEELGALPRGPRAAAVLAVLLIALAAAPTTAIDLYNTQDVENQARGPGFRWTLVLTHDEQEAFDWIKRHTPPSAIFQVDPLARDAGTWAYLPAFAERRMAVGLPISMVPLAKYQQGSSIIHDMLDMPDAAEVHALASRFGIRYLLSGPPERAAHQGLQTRLETRPDLFPLLFRNGTISIYAVRR